MTNKAITQDELINDFVQDLCESDTPDDSDTENVLTIDLRWLRGRLDEFAQLLQPEQVHQDVPCINCNETGSVQVYEDSNPATRSTTVDCQECKGNGYTIEQVQKDGVVSHDAYRGAMDRAYTAEKEVHRLNLENSRLAKALADEVNGPTFMGEPLLKQPTAPGGEAVADDVRDAARWRAFVDCKRIRLFGWAGYASPDPNGQDPGNYRHFGAEFWTEYPVDTENKDDARMALEGFADAAIAASVKGGE